MTNTTTAKENLKTPLRLEAIGVPRVLLNEEAITLPTRHAMQALFLLGFAQDGELPITLLGELLWPDAAESQIPPRFATMVWQLKKALGDASCVVDRNRQRIRLDLDRVSMDITDYRRDAHAAISEGRMDEQALTGLRSPMLTTWNGYPWVDEERATNATLASQLSTLG